MADLCPGCGNDFDECSCGPGNAMPMYQKNVVPPFKLGLRYVQGVYVDDVEVKHPDTGEIISLSVWMNPETRSLVAVGNMEYVILPRNYVNDPYVDGVGIVFHDTFSGLPK